MPRCALILLVACSFSSLAWAAAEPAAAASGEEAAVRKQGDAYTAAFNARDAKALAALWSPEGVYTDRATGASVVGTKAIAEQYAALFKAQPEVKLDSQSESVPFLSPNVAVERGTARLIAPKNEPLEADYTAVYVKREGQWLLDRVTDDAKTARDEHSQKLAELEWLVGSWVDQDENVSIETHCDWTKNRTYLTRSFKVSVAGKVQMSGMQVIGWDAGKKQICSWTFDSDGGFAQAAWSHEKDSWVIRNVGTLADGRKATMVNVIKPVDANSFTWETIERTVAGEILPNIDRVTIVRQ